MKLRVVQDRLSEALLDSDHVSLVALVVANVFPLVGVLAWHWDAGAVVLLYWWENLIVGFYAMLRMALAPPDKGNSQAAKVFMIPFFCIHYGGFCAVHGGLLLALFGAEGVHERIFPSHQDMWWGPFIFLQLLAHVIAAAWNRLARWAGWALVAIAVSHGISFVRNYWLGSERRGTTLTNEMFRPYGRIVLLHLCILFGAFLAVAVGSPLPVLMLLVVVKTAVDVAMHAVTHQKGKNAT